jgi:hypothetical protein
MSSRVLNGSVLRRLALAVAALAALMLMGDTTPARAVNLYRTLTSSFRAPFELPFEGVGGIATSPAGTYVYVGTGGRVIQYSDSGVWVRTWSTPFGEISGIATDPSGDVYVADSTNGQVQEFDENGGHIATWSVPGVRQIASDAHGQVFLLVFVVVGYVVDVRSYSGTDEGAWSAVLPGSWFGFSGYLPATTSSIATLSSDAAGNVVLGGISTQRLEGFGPDCHSVFEGHPENEFLYDDPLQSGEVARYTSNGVVLSYGWLNSSTTACYPGWKSYGDPLAAAVAPDDDAIWLSQYYGEFLEEMTTGGYSPVTSSLETTRTPQTSKLLGPAAFDCHGNLFFGSGDHVVEFIASPRLSCPSRLSQLARLTLAPSLTVVTQTVEKTKKSMTLDFDAGCTGNGCTISALAQARLPHCRRGSCLVVLARGRFSLKGAAEKLALTLSHADETLLRRDPRLEIHLSARLLRHGRAFGPTFRAGGGHALLALPAVQMSVACPAQATLGSQMTVSGALGLSGVHALKVSSSSLSGHTSQQLQTTSAGTFTLEVGASTGGVWTFTASYGGDRLHGPSGNSCSTEVPLPPATTHEKALPPLAVTEGVTFTTILSLSCRNPEAGKPEFTGTIAPRLPEVPITILYKFKFGGMEEERSDPVMTNAEGGFHDKGPPADAKGEATASWPGDTGYTGATSPSCKFEQ